MPSALFSFKQADHPILGGFSPPRKVQTPPEVVDEARQRHYQDQPFSTAALMGGAAGLAAPTALGLLLDHKAVLRNPMPYLHAGAVMSPLGAVTGVGAEAAGRLLTRGLGPGFDRRRWHRDQDPHRWNSALRTAPLVAALLAGRALPSLLQRMPELQGKQASAGWSEWLKNKTQNALDPVKRYISNLPGLYGYHKGHVENAIKYLPKAYDMGIKDIPAQPQAAAQPGTNEWRRELFRRGLGVHNAGPNDAFKVSPDGTLQAADRFFKNDEMDPGQAWQLLGSDAASELEGKEHSAYDRAARSGKPNANKSVVSAPTDSSVFSNYTMKYKGNGIFNVSDKWDVGLNPGEENKLDGKGVVGLARKTLDKMMTPAVFNQDFQQRRDGSVVRINQTPVPSHPSVPAVKGSSALRDHKTRLRDAEAQVAVPTQGQIEGGGNLGSWKIASHLMDDFQKGAHGQVMLHDIDRSCTHHNVVSRVSQGGIASVQAHDIWMAKHAAARLAPLAPLMGAYSLKSCAGVETQTRLFLPQLLQERNIQIEKKTLGSTPVSCVVQQGKKGSSQSAAVFGSPFSLLLQPAGTAEMHVSPFVHLKLAQRLGFATFAAGDAASFQRFSHPAFSSNTSAVEPDRVFGVGDQITQGFGGAKYAGRGVTSFWGVLDEMNTSFPFERLNGIENPVAVAARHELPFSFFKASSQSESLKRFTRAGSAHKPDGNPSKAQINAGNYKMQHLQIHGLEITLETASGQERKGVAADGKPWSVTLTDPYGYIKNTDSAEPGDQMDVFIGPDPSSEAVYVVDQNKPGTTRFDEHKVVLGCTTMAEAKALYLRNYSKGWTGFRDITPMTMPQFKSWLKKGDVTRPLAGQQFADFHKQASNAARRLFTNLMRDTLQGRIGWHGANAPNVSSIARNQILRPGVMTAHGADLTLSQPLPLPAFARQGGLVGVDLARTGTPITPQGFSTKARGSTIGAWANSAEMPLTGGGTPHLHAPQQDLNLSGGGLRYVAGVDKTLARNTGARLLPEGLSSWWSRMTQATGTPFKSWSGADTPSITAQDAARGLAKLFPSGRIGQKTLSTPPAWSAINTGALNAQSWLARQWSNLKAHTHDLWGKQSGDFHKQANAWRAISLALLKAQRKGGLRPGTSPIIGKDVAALAAAAMGAGWFAGDAYFKRKAQALTEENEALSSERDALTAEQSAEYERLKPRAGKAWQAYFESKHPVGPDGQYLTPLTPQEVEDKSRIHALLGTQPEKPVTPTSQSTSHPAVTDYAPSLRDAGFGAGGAALGYGLGSLMLPENDEEDAPALQRYAPHIGAALGAGGGMLLSRYLQGSTKQAFDWNALAQSIKEQAPRLHVPEATVGALAGGAAGALYHGASSLWEDPRHHARQSLLRRALIGAGIGGVGANLVGDRARRYISNMPNPATYDINSKLQEMGAAGWKGFMTGAIKDKPIPLTAENSHITPMRMIRRETLRRGFGVHTDDPISDYLKVIGKSRNGADILNLSDRFFDKNQQIRPEFRDVWQQLAPRDFNSIMSAPSGKFVHANGPFLGNFSARNFGDTAQFLDRWDFDLHPDERSDMKSNLMDWWRGAAKPQPFQNMGLQFNLGKQRADATKSMLARHAVDQTVAKNMPYFFQSFRIPTPEEGQAYDAWDSPELPYRIPLFNDK